MPDLDHSDLLACLDVVKLLTEKIDDLGAEEALRFRADVKAITDASKFAHELLETRAVSLLESQPIVIDGTVYATQTSGKWRPEHQKIREMIIDRAIAESVEKETGEQNLRKAVRIAVELCYEAFVSPSTMAKQKFVEETMGVSNKQIAIWERGRKTLKTMKLAEVDDES